MPDQEQLVYVETPPIERTEAEAAFDGGEPRLIGDALFRLTHHDRDWRYVYQQCLRFSTHADLWVRRNAATCLGELAVFHRDPQINDAIPILESMSKDPDVAPFADDAIDDIRHALRRRRVKKP